MWALSGTLDTETGLALSIALESVCEAIRSEDRERDLAQLRHDALGVLLGGELSAGLPVHKGVRPHLMVVVRDDSVRAASSAAIGWRCAALRTWPLRRLPNSSIERTRRPEGSG